MLTGDISRILIAINVVECKMAAAMASLTNEKTDYVLLVQLSMCNCRAVIHWLVVPKHVSFLANGAPK